MPALMIPYDTIHICMHRGSCGPQAINIHILTSLIYNSADH